MRVQIWPVVIGTVALGGAFTSARPTAELSPNARRGLDCLTQKAYVPATWTRAAYDNAWRHWPNQAAKPADYDQAFREHYGLHPAPFPNQNLPMGLKVTKPFLGRTITLDCLVCHGGSILGHSYIGLGNVSLDIQAIFDELSAADGLPYRTPFRFSRVRGTSEAGAMAVYLLGRRNPDLSHRIVPVQLGLHDDMIEDPPAWWLLKKKKTMYATGGGDARSVRSMMQFMMSPLTRAEAFPEAEPDFAAIRQLMLELQPPKYPFPVDAKLAQRGESLFIDNCARCHGTYGPDGRYPNKIIALDEIGTDRRRYDALEERFGEYYNRSWFAKEHAGWLSDGYTGIKTDGYQAPPLDGIWATAPYLHNGSVPTVYHLLNSASRPRRFTRSFRTGIDDYDSRQLGWRITEVAGEASAAERPRTVYDTNQPGRGNQGHLFGDHLTDEERTAIIEFLKTL